LILLTGIFPNVLISPISSGIAEWLS